MSGGRILVHASMVAAIILGVLAGQAIYTLLGG